LKAGEPSQALAGKSIAILFEKPSLRTKLSFEVGIHRLGGHPVYFSPEEVGLGKREPVQDVARVMSRMADAAIIRTFDHGILEQFSEASTIPVINALTDGEHPCQALADLQTIEESKGSLDGVRVAYIGDGNNVAISLALGMASIGGHLTIASPGGYTMPETTEIDVAPLNAKSGGSLKLVSDPVEAVSDADIVYTDVWTSMGQEEETQIRLEAFRGYQVNPALLDKAPSGVRFMHDLPAHPGEEISDGLLTDPRSIAFDQAENRLHAQAGLLHFLFSGA
jgi:ornithine carbamoyltransferase